MGRGEEAGMTGLEALLKTLGEAGVQFVVIGGVAMYAHGSTRLTRDLDICYERSPANLERLARALSEYHPRLRGASDSIAFCLDGRALSRGMNFTLSTDLGDIDLIGEVPGLGQHPQVELWATTVEVEGTLCRVLSLRGLIQSKRASGRPRDLEALRELEALADLEQGSGDAESGTYGEE
ncbi:MAG: nucleotidyltransferase [Acidobacteria bacterium]|nr:MAG: nucleotidyltransferase [Acidobacteriota bacterium]